MDPSELKERLDSYLHETETWQTKDLFIDAFVKKDNGDFESVVVDLCRHIGCGSNDRDARKAHQNEFKSRLQEGSNLEKYYLSSIYNSETEKGRKDVAKFIINLFDKCGGGVVSTGRSKAKANSLDIVFRCFRHRIALKKKKVMALTQSLQRPPGRNKRRRDAVGGSLYILSPLLRIS